MSGALGEVHVGLIKIPVADFERACEFYREVLGLQEDFAIAEFRWAQYSTGNVPLCLYVPAEGVGDGAVGGETGVQLRIADAQDAFARLTEFADSPLQRGDDGTTSFTLRDTEGNRLQVLQMPSAATP